MAFAPAQTTITGVCASSCRSALMSLPRLAFAPAPRPRCTPPIPPVAKTSMPARCAIHMVAATVVAPSNLPRHRDGQVAPADFAHVRRRGQVHNLRVVQSRDKLAANDADGARLRPVVAHHGLHVPRQRQVLRIRAVHAK